MSQADLYKHALESRLNEEAGRFLKPEVLVGKFISMNGLLVPRSVIETSQGISAFSDDYHFILTQSPLDSFSERFAFRQNNYLLEGEVTGERISLQYTAKVTAAIRENFEFSDSPELIPFDVSFYDSRRDNSALWFGKSARSSSTQDSYPGI